MPKYQIILSIEDQIQAVSFDISSDTAIIKSVTGDDPQLVKRNLMTLLKLIPDKATTTKGASVKSIFPLKRDK